MNQTVTETDRASTLASTGRDLIVVKGAVVKSEFAKLGLRLRSNGNSGTGARDSGAYGAGKAAGDRVSFNRGVGHAAGGTALLGR